METQTPLEQLHYVKLRIPRLIPADLIESVKGRTFSAEEFYDFQDKHIDNPYNFLYVLVNDEKRIHGYLWAEQSILDGSLFVNTFSISKDYWGKGKAMQKAFEIVNHIKTSIKPARVYWITTNDKFFVKHGFKRSKNILMEYIEEKGDSHGPT